MSRNVGYGATKRSISSSQSIGGSEKPLTEAELEKVVMARQAEAFRAHRDAVVASALANVQLKHTKNTLDQYVNLYAESLAENESLSEALQEQDTDSVKVIQFLSDSLDAKDKKVQKLEREINTIATDVENKFKKEIAELNQLVENKETELNRMRATLHARNEEISQLNQFVPKEKHQLLNSIASLQDENTELICTYEEKLSHMTLMNMEEKSKIGKIEEKLIKQFETRVEEEALQLIGPKTRQILEENDALNSQKSKLEDHLEEFMKQNDQLSRKFRQKKVECELGEEAIAAYAKQGLQLSQVACKAVNKSKQLEEEKSGYQLQKQIRCDDKADLSHNDSEQLRAAIRSMKHSLGIHRKELIQVKGLARKMLHQRSAMENFFYDCIRECQEQHRHSASHMAVAQVSVEPDIANSVNTSSDKSDFVILSQDAIEDISTLQWSQKEKIIQSLLHMLLSDTHHQGESKAGGSHHVETYYDPIQRHKTSRKFYKNNVRLLHAGPRGERQQQVVPAVFEDASCEAVSWGEGISTKTILDGNIQSCETKSSISAEIDNNVAVKNTSRLPTRDRTSRPNSIFSVTLPSFRPNTSIQQPPPTTSTSRTISGYRRAAQSTGHLPFSSLSSRLPPPTSQSTRFVPSSRKWEREKLSTDMGFSDNEPIGMESLGGTLTARATRPATTFRSNLHNETALPNISRK